VVGIMLEMADPAAASSGDLPRGRQLLVLVCYQSSDVCTVTETAAARCRHSTAVIHRCVAACVCVLLGVLLGEEWIACCSMQC
jgi:hypothetical protein